MRRDCLLATLARTLITLIVFSHTQTLTHSFIHYTAAWPLCETLIHKQAALATV